MRPLCCRSRPHPVRGQAFRVMTRSLACGSEPSLTAQRLLERGLEQLEAEVDLGLAHGERRRDPHDAGGVPSAHDVGAETEGERGFGYGIGERLRGLAAAASVR